jgi:hypothetical protein
MSAMAENLSTTGSGGPLGATVLAKDTFSDVANTDLTSHSMDVGQGWATTPATGAFTIQTNQARGAGASQLARTQTNQSNVTAQVQVTFPFVGNDIGLILRYQDDSNYWGAVLDTGTETLEIYELVSGSFTLRASSNPGLNPGTPYTVKAVCSGNTITATVNGGNQAQYASAADFNNLTYFGIEAGELDANPQGELFDNFQVTQP